MTWTTFNPANISRVTLSGGNLIATESAGHIGGGGARVIDAWATGKYHFELISSGAYSAGSGDGIAVAMTSAAYLSLIITAVNGVVVSAKSGNININSSTPTISGAAAVPGLGTIVVEVDLGARLFWAAKTTGNWNANALANPATGVGGVNISTLTGPLLIFALTQDVTGGPLTWTLNAGQNSFGRAVSSGFTPGWPTGVSTTSMFFSS